MCPCLCWEAASAHTYMFYHSVKLPVNLLALQTILLPFYIINWCVNHNDESLITSFCTMPWALSILIENNQTKTKHWFNTVICPISPWWRHQMEIFSALLAICAGQWRGALMFTLICTRINGWVNNREAGVLRRYRAHYDVIVRSLPYFVEVLYHSFSPITVGWHLLLTKHTLPITPLWTALHMKEYWFLGNVLPVIKA